MFVVLFIFEFAILFLLAKFLIKSLSRLLMRVIKSEKATIALLAYLFLPGTIVHELAHLLAAGLLFVGAGNMQLTPKIIEDGVRLGSVDIGKTDILRRAIIGVSPVLVGIAVIFGTLFYLQTSGLVNIIIYAIAFWIIFEVSNTLFSSRKDLEGTFEFLITSLILAAAIFIIWPSLFQTTLRIFQEKALLNFFKTADLFLIAPILIDLVLISITGLFIRQQR